MSSHLDYCNSLLYGIADIGLTQLPLIQNRLACLVTKSPPFIRSVPLLRSLHWLPVRFRILFYGARIAERVSALDWLLLCCAAIIALRVSNPSLHP